MALRYEKWSLGYWALKNYVRIAQWLTHNKTIVLNSDNIPKDKPILFTPNHQNALMDPMAILLNTNIQPVWLARADIFKNKTLAAVLRFMKIMPVYRMRDGKENLGKNDETFSMSVKVLQSNKALALFPEGAHTGRRQMIAHKKAAPRIVFMAEEMTKENLDIQIIPSGLYYSHYWKFDRTLIVNFGTPIPVNRFLEEYKSNPNAATLSMKEAIFKGIKPLVVNVNNKEHYENLENILDYYAPHHLRKSGEKVNALNIFHSKKDIIDLINKLETTDPQQFAALVQQEKEYTHLLKNYKLRSWLLEKTNSNILNLAGNLLFLILCLPVFLAGFILNSIPFFAIDKTVRKLFKDYAFYSSGALVLGLILFPLIYVIELLILSPLLPALWYKLVFLALAPVLGKIAFKWYILLRKTIGRMRLQIQISFNKTSYAELRQKRQDLFGILDKMGKEEG